MTKFNSSDQNRLWKSLQDAVQITNCIEEQELDGDIPPSVIPTDILYDLASCYMAMHEKVLEYELAHAGFAKSTNTH